MKKVINENDLKNLFNKPYGVNSPTQKKWSEFYSQNVVFIDPTQKTEGLDIMMVVDTSGSMQALDFTFEGKRQNRL